MSTDQTLPCLCTNPECPGAKLVVEVAADVVALSIEPDAAEIIVDRRALAELVQRAEEHTEVCR